MAIPNQKPSDEMFAQDGTLLDYFQGTPAANELRGGAKNLTIADLWRVNGWMKDGDPPNLGNAILRNLTMEEIRSIAAAFEVYINRDMKHPLKGWKYAQEMYSCCTCTCWP